MNNSSKVYLAIDLGATSGRVIAGLYDSSSRKLELDEVSRFPTKTIEEKGSLKWDIQDIFDRISEGLTAATRKYDSRIQSIGVDTWAVDYGLIDEEGELLGNPYHYRDSRTEGMPEAIRKLAPDEVIFSETGIQFLFLNTINQLFAEVNDSDSKIGRARWLLFIPDLVNHWLTGNAIQERTLASTSQLLNPITGKWSERLLKSLGLPEALFTSVVEPGSKVGALKREIQEATSLNSIPVIAVASHDTASAFMALPENRSDYAIMSSGTWSLMGIELERPELGEQALADGFSNEIGFGGTVRFLKNICGMWLIEECLKKWASEGTLYGYDQVVEMARSYEGSLSLIDPDAPKFAAPDSMPEAIREYCRNTGQSVPVEKEALLKCIFLSLALKYRYVFQKLRHHSPNPLKGLFMLGGGARNRFLNQLTADSLGVPVKTGPSEATAVGNIAAQLIASEELADLGNARTMVGASFPSETFEPKDEDRFEVEYVRFLGLVEKW
ncbi:MAG TPA: rhamnulokinase [Opitutae bacterium]|nr:rhamnulokinase [Opitutaceae bacterium]HCR28473.1 rhamnulokinase [Opitutae bacterium]